MGIGPVNRSDDTGSARVARRALRRRRAASLVCAITLALQTACYSYAPLQTVAPPPAKDVGLVINDRGRVLLGERVGALVDRIDGRLVSIDSSTIVLDVHRVTDLRGNASTWTGERVTIPREAVTGFRERKLSKFKTLLVIGAIAVAVIGTLTASLDVFGDGKPDPGPNGGPQTQ